MHVSICLCDHMLSSDNMHCSHEQFTHITIILYRSICCLHLQVLIMSHYSWQFYVSLSKGFYYVHVCAVITVHHAFCCAAVSLYWWNWCFCCAFQLMKAHSSTVIHGVTHVLQSVVCDLVWSAVRACVCCELCTHWYLHNEYAYEDLHAWYYVHHAPKIYSFWAVMRR